MKWGIIGFGNIARKFTRSITYSRDNQVIAIGSRSLSSDHDYLKSHPEVKLYRNYDELLEDHEIEAVYIALPHGSHYEWIMKALEHKKAVLVEKPAVLTSQQIVDVIDCASRNQTCFLEALKTKMNVGFLHLLEDIKMIGDIQTIYVNFCNDVRSLKGKSYCFEKGQGGAIYDLGSYLAGFVLKLVDNPVKEIQVEGNIVDDVDEHFIAKLTFESGCIATLEGAMDEDQIRYASIVGNNGSIHVPMYNRISEYTVTLNDGETIHKEYPIHGDDMTYQINVLHDCVINHKIESELHDFEETRQVIEILERIHDELYKGL